MMLSGVSNWEGSEVVGKYAVRQPQKAAARCGYYSNRTDGMTEWNCCFCLHIITLSSIVSLCVKLRDKK